MNLFWEITTAAVILIGTAANLIASFKQTKSTDDLIGSSKSELKTEHGSLSTEHRGIEHKIENVAVSISKDQAVMAKDVTTIIGNVKSIADVTGYLKEKSDAETNKQEARYIALTTNQKELRDSATKIGEFGEAFEKMASELGGLRFEVVTLQEELSTVKNENAELKAVIRSLQETHENEPEL